MSVATRRPSAPWRRHRSRRPCTEERRRSEPLIRRATLAAFSIVLTAGSACQTASPPARAAQQWAAGPVRWLLLPDERRDLRNIRSEHELTEFIRRFWRRRDPDPATPENDFLARFSTRVADADRLYGEGDRPGSLTDRGGALVLLGPPVELHVGQRRMPTFLDQDPTTGRATRLVTIETWVYPLDELDDRLRDLVHESGRKEVSLTFQAGDRRTRLIEGESVLRLAARVAVLDD